VDATGRPSPDAVRQLLNGVVDPELGASLVELGMVQDVAVDGGQVAVTIALTIAGCPLKAQVKRDIEARVGSYPGVAGVSITWDVLSAEARAEAMAVARRKAQERAPDTAIPATCRVIAVASGKGGVGKSSVTVNVAAAVAACGYTVGVLDADIGGYSVPRMLGVHQRLEATDEKRIVPIEKSVGDGRIQVVSMGNLVDDEESALMWNGRTLNRAVQHFMEDVDWDQLDYLFIDMPPGTGDIQMSLGRMLPRTEVIIVTTPALTAQKVATRAVDIARKSSLRVVGAVENMSEFITPDGERHTLFGEGGGEALAAAAGVPLLARIPIDGAVALGGDNGQPIALGEGPAAEAFGALADLILTEAAPPIAMDGCSARLLDAVEAALDAGT
jgi:ATP-binding protein involved in chromosome partitioning